ncbi:hypothetical protein GH714_026172 [Hevea brasiliensis]|uniref:arginine--tRNA ligase n=1 Tax=Hevea brasiliensis TaxID=3981 RepID=A0A6A6LU29_HEVBR|nr:hypothetical protein GH714_026172 [Hevea brasiliensis]
MANTNEENCGNLKKQLAKLFEASLRETVPSKPDVEPLVAACTAKFGDYQCNNAMSLWSKIKGKNSEFKGPPAVGQAVMRNLPPSEMIESCSVAGPGFVNIVLSKSWLAEFGMLIEFLFEKFPNFEDVNERAIGDLQEFYKASKQRFDADSAFKERAQKAVVRLQGGEPKYRQAWVKICDISRKEFDKLHVKFSKCDVARVGRKLLQSIHSWGYRGIEQSRMVQESEGARVIFIEGINIPLIVVKSDGGYNYASTDLTALWYRLNEEKAEWIIYVTDVGQQQHFDMAAKRAGWLPAGDRMFPKASHVGFGLVLGDDGKRFRIRATEVVRLVDLLDEAKTRSKAALVEREHINITLIFWTGKTEEWTEEELEQTAEAIGYGAIKYADLKNNRLTNYTFNYDQMLNDKTGVLALGHPDECALGLHLLQFAETVEEACTNLLPNVLCEYLYNLSEHFTKFYSNCQLWSNNAKILC